MQPAPKDSVIKAPKIIGDFFITIFYIKQKSFTPPYLQLDKFVNINTFMVH